MSSLAPAVDQLSKLTLNITQDIHVRASIQNTFAAILEELGPSNIGAQSAPMPMVLEAWPGGRWFRDLGNNNGHLWGHVQAIKSPTLLEIYGPLMMSFAAASNVQYRLKEVDGGTLITMHHSALGLFPEGYREAMTSGWPQLAERIKQRAERE
jgi:hypothetical protein